MQAFGDVVQAVAKSVTNVASYFNSDHGCLELLQFLVFFCCCQKTLEFTTVMKWKRRIYLFFFTVVYLLAKSLWNIPMREYFFISRMFTFPSSYNIVLQEFRLNNI